MSMKPYKFALLLSTIFAFAVLECYAQSPAISSLSPTSGAVGTPVTITGTNFGAAQTGPVTFNGVAGTPTSWSDTQIVVPVPSGASSGNVVVSVGNTASVGVNFIVLLVAQAPVLQVRVDDTPATVNLSDPANLDWVIWGADGSTPTATRSSAGLISNYTVLGNSNVSVYSNGETQYTWSGGTPIASSSGSTPYINVYGLNAGFQLTVPADTTVKTFKLYASSCANMQINASLSDGSSPAVSSNTVTYSCNETYSIDFRAASAGQTLTVQVFSTDTGSGMSISAAVLQPHLPQVAITSPQDQQSYTYGSAIPVEVDASQYDYNIVSTTLSANGSQVLASQTSPLITTWSNAPQGHYQLQAAAVDSNGLSGTSKAISVDVIGTGGSLSESFGTVTSNVDLTTEGTADWIAFAMTNWNYTVGSQKAGVYQLISSPTIVGINQGSGTYFLSGGLFSFEDGTPDPQENGVTPVAWVGGPPQTGFKLSVKADTTPRTLRLYCNASGATQLRAYLSDGSAPLVTDTSLQNSNAQYVFTINFNAASAGQNLVIDLVTVNGGATFLNAATLTGTSVPLPPQVTAVQPNSGVAGDSVTIFGSAFGSQQGSVSFNGVQAIVASWTQTSIGAFVPGGTGTGPVVVTTSAGTSNSDVLFAMRPSILAITPNSGAIGTTVTLTGAGFGSVGTVSFNGVPASVSSWSDSQIVAVVPSGATTGAVIAVQSGVSSNSAWFTVLSGVQAAPLLKLRVDDTPAKVTLSDAVNLDWVIWGADSQTTAATRMAGANLISDPLNGATASSLSSGCRPAFSWNGGTPIVNGTSGSGCVSVTDSVGGVLLTVPAGTTVQTLKVYVQAWGNPEAVAYLSDGSTDTLADTSVSGPSYVGEEKTYSFDFRAASAGQQLTVMMLGNYILESAVLQPHLPEVSLLTPTSGTSFAANSNVALGINPLQFDNQIAATAVAVNQNPIFESTTTPYDGIWQAPAGHYRVQATATDSAGLMGKSGNHDVDVIGNGGVLTGSATKLTISNTINTDLTTEGTADWILFAPPVGWPSIPYDDWAGVLMDGNFKGVIRKSAVSPLISRARPLGQGNFSDTSGSTSEYFQFEDGTPDPADVQISDGLSAAGAQSGYEFKVKADTTLRTLRLHAGIANGQAHLKAFLSDGSAPIFVDDTLQPDQGYWATSGVYSIQYQAASANQTLTVQLTLDGTPSINDDWKAVELFAATVDGPPVPVTTGSDTTGPTLTVTSPASGTVFSQRDITIQGTVTDAQSGVSWVWCGDGVNFANIQGNSFTCSVELVGGANSVGITAGDKAKNEASTTLSVSFIPSVGQSASGKLLSPDQLNLLVGETHNIRKVGTDNVNQGDCGYYSSDTSVATVSATDCINGTVTAVSPGTAEIISADAGATITVYDGTALPAGTVQWSVPSTQGTVNEITPQPPYTVQSFDASIQSIPPAFYAREGTYYVTAFSADGIQLRENQMLTGGWDPALYTHPLVPDFQGRIALPYPNLVGGSDAQMQQYPQGLVVYDATTGAGGYPVVYTYQNGALQHFGPGFNQYDPQAALIPSLDGTYYVADPPYIKALDSLNPNTDGTFPAKFSAAISGCSGGQNVHTGKMILAGDGALYVPFGDYTTSQGTDSNGNTITIYPCNRLGVMRVNPDGTYQEMTLFDFPAQQLWAASALTNLSMISNADQGAYMAFSDYSTAQAENDSADPPSPAVPPTAYLAVVSSGGMSLASPSSVPNGVYTISLQAEDGSIIGSMPVPTTCPDGSSGCAVSAMIRMDSGGNITQSIQNATPSYALSDGSIVANGGQTTYDANGNITATSPYSITMDWHGNLTGTQSSANGLSADMARARAMNSIASGGVSQSIPASIPASTASGVRAMDFAVRVPDISPGTNAVISKINQFMVPASGFWAVTGGSFSNNGVAIPTLGTQVDVYVDLAVAGAIEQISNCKPVKGPNDLPPDAQSCSATLSFYAPPGYSINEVVSTGKALGKWNPLGTVEAAFWCGTYDYQRMKNSAGQWIFYSGYTPVSNINVGALLEGEGWSRDVANLFASQIARGARSKGSSSTRSTYTALGYDLAANGWTPTCYP